MYRIIVKSPPHIYTLIEATQQFPHGWAGALHGDLKWLATSDKFSECSNFSLGDWFRHVAKNSKPSFAAMRKFCKSPFANVVTQWATTPSLKVYAEPIECPYCNSKQYSKQSFDLHVFKAHGVKCSIRRYVNETHCLVCLKELWTRERCLNHIRYRSKVCLANSILRGPLLTSEEANALDDDCKALNCSLYRAGKRRHFASTPAIRLAGPLLPICLDDDRSEEHTV